MKTPICDFCQKYNASSPIRAHMPGHKGVGINGEDLDLTEIDGADSLYFAEGIIKESEDNASLLFGCPTYYSTEGSSQCIRAMLHLISLHAREKGLPFRICAAPNVHSSFVSACALLDAEVIWLGSRDGYLSYAPDLTELKTLFLSESKPVALYVTSPDYLGNTAPIKALAELCHDHGVLLAVDNAHGAYLKFMPKDTHPVTLGADICCDSAHKTLPVLTGGAYLHISPDAPSSFTARAKGALSLFGSTSPSYLILQSLDRCNVFLESLKERLSILIPRIDGLKEALVGHGYTLTGDEALKITVCAKPYGYSGHELARICAERGLVTEFSDPDYTVLMLTDESRDDLSKITEILLSIPKKEPLSGTPPTVCRGARAMSIREAVLSPFESVNAEDSVGRIVASLSLSCPPAVPIAVSGEVITENTLALFSYYGIKTVSVVRNQ